MSENTKVLIPREVIEGYFQSYYKYKWKIDETIQPNFWEAVILLCNNLDADVSHLIDDSVEAQCCIGDFGKRRAHVSEIDDKIKDVKQLAKDIATSIHESETTEISKLEIFLMKKRMESMKRNMRLLASEL